MSDLLGTLLACLLLGELAGVLYEPFGFLSRRLARAGEAAGRREAEQTDVRCRKVKAGGEKERVRPAPPASALPARELPVPARRLAFRALAAALDVLFFALCGGLYLAFAAAFCLPSFRPYMAAAAACGFALWRGSLRRTLAFLCKKLYNTDRSGRERKMRARRPSGYNEGRKV